MLSAEIIAVGSEMLTPERSDTNGLWLTARLNEVGIEVMLKTIVGDDEARLAESIGDAVRRSDVVITTGGLGPTDDDVTRQASARAVGRELVYREELETELRERFKRWGREMPEINRRQAFVIDGAEVLPNPNGSAAGMLYRTDHQFLAVMPGPPREMKPMFETLVFPRLRELAGGLMTLRRVLRVSGMGESAVDEIAAPIYREFKEISTSVLFNRTEVEIHLAARGSDRAAVEEALDGLAARLQQAFDIAMFATHGETMEEVVGGMLLERGETVAVAESCTGGLLGARLTEIAGSSRYFIEGVTSYANEAKIKVLSVPEETLERFGAVSGETAEAMAGGVRALAGTDHALSVTGIAGPDGGTEEKPVGTVYVGYSSVAGERSKRLLLPGDRELIRWRSTQAALDILRRAMLKSRPEE